MTASNHGARADQDNRNGGLGTGVLGCRRALRAARAQRAVKRSRARIVHHQTSDRGIHGVGGGRAVHVSAPREYRGTAAQVCGLYPFATGAASPMIGVPVGISLLDGAPVCCDPISWFQDANLIHNPSGFVLGLPGLGKSTLMRRIVIGAAGMGQIPMILGDLKPDYVPVIRGLGGQVIALGQGRGFWNVLDIEDDKRAAVRLEQAGFLKEAGEVRADARHRRATLVEGLIEIARKEVMSDREKQVLGTALEILDRREEIPLLRDVLALIDARPRELSDAALDRGDPERYKDVTENLRVSLRGLTGAGRLGEIFSKQTTVRMQPNKPMVFDISAVEGNDLALQAAVLLTCWTAGFGMIRTQQTLTVCGLEPLRHYLAVTDEIWRPLRVGDFMVERMDTNTRLNRTIGVGTLMCTHSMQDLESLSTERARHIARGFVERAGFVVMGGLPRKELDQTVNTGAVLPTVVSLSESEVMTVSSWVSPPAFTRGVAAAEPPGRGHFLIKIGGRPGVPFKTVLTANELLVNDTNQLWHEHSRVGPVTNRQAPS
jgi:hypothetical protein